jgi:uncharacterized protein YecT (DUF1311 family)
MPGRHAGVSALACTAVVAVAATPSVATPRSSRAALAPPVVAEPFTPLPCPNRPQTTLDLEGCAEQQVLRIDAQINRTARVVFSRLHDTAAKRRFIAAQRAWVAYRRADCASVADEYEGGSLGGVIAGRCLADRSKVRLGELRAFARALVPVARG